MIGRVDQFSKPSALETAWQFAHFAEQNNRNIADNIGRMIVAEPSEHQRDAMLDPYFRVRRAQHQLRRAAR